MSIKDELKKKSEEIRHWAVKRMFEDEGYKAERKGEDEGGFFTGRKELTKERYEGGPSPHPSRANPDDMDENSKYIARQGTDVWKMKYDEIVWVYDSVKQFGQGNPSQLKSLISSVSGVPFELMGQEDWADNVSKLKRSDDSGKYKGTEILLENAIHEAKNWDGDTAATFVATYGADGDKWESAVQGNYYMSEALVKAAEAQLALIIAAREDVLEICDATISALSKMESDNSGDATFGLAVLGAITTAGLTLASFGTAATIAGAAFAITGAAVSAAENGSDPGTGVSGGKYTIGGDSAVGILVSMNSAISKVTKGMFDQESDIANGLVNVHNAALGDRSRYVIGTDTPELSNPTDGWGNRVSGNLIALEEAAKESFPPAAKRLHSANNDLAAVSGESAAFHAETYGFETVVCDPWIALRHLIQDYVGSNANKVENTGKVMLQFAKNAGVVDDDASKKIDKTYKNFDSTGSGQEHEKLDKV
ncbi:MAG TPA: hypothetical protein H9902_04230 [Candidatus Stackebrandtia faecavium]|nr:hypothetical protein [Candidatus Stackebrandtia faecavium]